jgi:hypothetical protein
VREASGRNFAGCGCRSPVIESPPLPANAVHLLQPAIQCITRSTSWRDRVLPERQRRRGPSTLTCTEQRLDLISGALPTVLTEALDCFPQSLQRNSVIVTLSIKIEVKAEM